MARQLLGQKIAILVTDGFEYVELVRPRKALDDAGARTSVVSPKADRVRGRNFTDWGDHLSVDVLLDSASSEAFDALLLPGGGVNPDSRRIQPHAGAFVKRFFDEGKPVAAICHGPWNIINADWARGRRMTSWPSLEIDLRNAGAQWVDEDAVTDQGLVTSRTPDDIPAFNQAMIDLFGRKRARHARRG
jgi:protease I